MKLYEEIDSDSLNTQRYSIYHLNRADNFLIKNSIKFFLFNTSEKNLENSLQQYKLLKSIEITPTLFTPNIDFFLSNNIPHKDIVETSGYSFLNNFNEIIKRCNSNYIFLVSSNIILDNIDEIVNRFYLTYQNFSNKLSGWTINIHGDKAPKICQEYKIENNIYFLPYFSMEFFCLRTDYFRKIGYLSLIKDNEKCYGLEYLISFFISQNEEYFVGDFNYSLNLIDKNKIKTRNMIEKQYTFLETHKNVYGLSEHFFGYWNSNLVDQ
jgi:hypothetical protein